jgi:hypothetical protein
VFNISNIVVVFCKPKFVELRIKKASGCQLTPKPNLRGSEARIIAVVPQEFDSPKPPLQVDVKFSAAVESEY